MKGSYRFGGKRFAFKVPSKPKLARKSVKTVGLRRYALEATGFESVADIQRVASQYSGGLL